VIRLAVRVQRADAELVLAELLELAPAGVEEVALDERTVEYAVYGAPGELPSLPDLTGAAGEALVEVSTSEIADNWQERWKEFHHPVLIEPPAQDAPGNGSDRPPALHVRAPWQAPTKHPHALEIVVEPGQAFGTGAHATTRLCLELMLELLAAEGAGGALLDVGTGSGVLAIAGVKLGFSPVLGVDHDRDSIAAAIVNARRNDAAIDVRRVDLRREPLPVADAAASGASPLVLVANLLAPLLIELADALPSAPDHLIIGGLLSGEADRVSAAVAHQLHLRQRAVRRRGEWSAVWLVRDEAHRTDAR
jgi:ribosomal protein L11 methyltransferase